MYVTTPIRYKTQDGYQTHIDEHLKICRDFFLFTHDRFASAENGHRELQTGNYLLISICQYNFSPNLGMLVNARQVPVLG